MPFLRRARNNGMQANSLGISHMFVLLHNSQHLSQAALLLEDFRERRTLMGAQSEQLCQQTGGMCNAHAQPNLQHPSDGNDAKPIDACLSRFQAESLHMALQTGAAQRLSTPFLVRQMLRCLQSLCRWTMTATCMSMRC